MTACPGGFLIGLVLVLSSGCASQNQPGEATRQVRINGQAFQVTQLTEATWTLTAAAGQQPLARDGLARSAMIEALEGVSGCKVTDSDYSQAGRQLDAQVDCAGRLKH